VPVDASDYTLERLDSASLAFATQLPGDVRVSIDLAWAGSGVLRYSKFHDHERIPGCKVNFHDHLVYTFAELTGTVTVTVGGATTVLDAEDALDARLSDYKVGVTSVGCQ
jgi:hypothetical protein